MGSVRWVGGAALCALASASAGAQTTLGFEERGYAAEACAWGGQDNLNSAGGYGGFSWSNLYALDLQNYFGGCYGRVRTEGTGYPIGPVATTAGISGVIGLGHLATGGGFSSGGALFSLRSGDFGAGWQDIGLTILGYRGGALQFSETRGITAGGYNAWTLANQTLVDEIRFVANYDPDGNGTIEDPFHSAWETEAGTVYQTYYFDNLQISTVPEPGSVALVGLGLAGVGLVARRRRKR